MLFINYIILYPLLQVLPILKKLRLPDMGVITYKRGAALFSSLPSPHGPAFRVVGSAYYDNRFL
jgi:hypothetical protein